jgi:hypothetical protein
MSIFDVMLAPFAIVGLLALAGGIVAWHAWRDWLRDNGFKV